MASPRPSVGDDELKGLRSDFRMRSLELPLIIEEIEDRFRNASRRTTRLDARSDPDCTLTAAHHADIRAAVCRIQGFPRRLLEQEKFPSRVLARDLPVVGPVLD